MPQVKFDFYTINMPEGSSMSFKQALEEMAALPTEERLKEIDGSTCFLISSLKLSRYTAYLFTKIRMDALPPKTRVNGERSPLQLDDDEGLGEDVAIAYNEAINIVSIQRNRHSLSANNIVKLICMVFPEIQIQLLPILRNDALERFSRCNTLKKLRLKLSGTGDLSFLENSDLSTNDKVTFQQILTEPYVDVVFSVGRKNAVLTEKIRKYAEFFTNLFRTGDTETVLAVEVSGKEDENAPTALIDLLQDRLIHIGEVATENRTINTNHLMRVACSAISENYEELRKNAS